MTVMRTITTTILKMGEAKVSKKGIDEVKLPDIEILGDPSPAKIDRTIRKLYGSRNVFVLSKSQDTAKYKMTLEEFKKLAQRY